MSSYQDKLNKAMELAQLGYGWEDIERRTGVVHQHAKKIVQMAAERKKKMRGVNVG